MFTTTTVLIAFIIYVLVRYFIIPFLRVWPGDMPQAKRLRRLESAGEFIKYFKLVSKTMPALRKIPEKDRINPQLSEKMMLAICGVNECSSCSYLHTQTALEKGVTDSQIRELLAGQFGGEAAQDVPALLFAQHYAESRGQVSYEAREAVVRVYGENKVRHMSGYLLTVFFGNLCCNTVEYYTHGRLDDKERRRLYFTYILARPVEWFISRGAAKRELKRKKMDGK